MVPPMPGPNPMPHALNGPNSPVRYPFRNIPPACTMTIHLSSSGIADMERIKVAIMEGFVMTTHAELLKMILDLISHYSHSNQAQQLHISFLHRVQQWHHHGSKLQPSSIVLSW
jgi:hypothetical protein